MSYSRICSGNSGKKIRKGTVIGKEIDAVTTITKVNTTVNQNNTIDILVTRERIDGQVQHSEKDKEQVWIGMSA